jgi:hypothetical protein
VRPDKIWQKLCPDLTTKTSKKPEFVPLFTECLS